MGASFALLAYTGTRAVLLSITHDEALSFLVIAGEYADWTANNHRLNTLGMRLCAWLFGPVEWSLRLPNVAAHGVWLAFSILFARRLTHPLAQISAFVLLNLNPFLLDFFGLARGYGLQAAALLASVWFVANAVEGNANSPPRLHRLWLAWAAAVIADYANFTAVDYHIPLAAVSLALVLWNPAASRLRLDLRTLGHAAALGLAHAVAGASVARHLLNLRALNELYDGGENLRDVLGSLVESSYHGQPPIPAVMAFHEAYFLALVLAGGVFALWRWHSTRQVTPALVVLAILAGAVVVIIAQNLILHALFPTERAAIFLIPPALAGIVLAAREAMASGRLAVFATVAGLTLPAVFAVVSFVRAFNLDHTHRWEFDKHNRAVAEQLATISREAQGATRVACHWWFAPGLNYYRITRGYTWMERILREDVVLPDDHTVAYLRAEDVEQLPPGVHWTETRFADSATVLVDFRPERPR